MGRRTEGRELRKFLDSVPAGIVIVETATQNILFANAHALSILRADLEDLAGRECPKVLCTDPPDDCAIQPDEEINEGRCILQARDGRRITVHRSITRVEFEGVPCLAALFRDISEELKLEALKEELDRITRHDLKTPLVQILNLAELLLLDGGLQPELRTYAGMIRKTGRRMVRIINASLDLYKMEKGTYSLVPESIRLKGLIRDIVVDVQSQVLDQGISFDMRFDEDVAVWGEDALVYCALANLIKNAAEATPRGGRVDIAVRKGEVATVSIHNQLPVPAEIRGRFMEKYTTHGKPHGTGLGTYSALLSVKAMQGDLTFVTSEELGTTVKVTLPLAPAAPARPFPRPDPAP